MHTYSTRTFHDLLNEVIRSGACHACGGCVSFCAAQQYHALTMAPDETPRCSRPDLCMECGVCYLICPETGMLEESTRQRLQAPEAGGHIRCFSLARASDDELAGSAAHGGAVTALLLHLFDAGAIQGAVVCATGENGQGGAFIAKTREDIERAAGYYPGPGGNAAALGQGYAGLSLAGCLGRIGKGWMQKVAFVGLPDQILAIRNLETLGLAPSDSVVLYLGLFCNGAWRMGHDERALLAKCGGFSWRDVVSFSQKNGVHLHLADGRDYTPPQSVQQSLRLSSCAACGDYAAELADISFGPMDGRQDWSTVLVRTDAGASAWSRAVQAGTVLEAPLEQRRRLRPEALAAIAYTSAVKRERAGKARSVSIPSMLLQTGEFDQAKTL